MRLFTLVFVLSTALSVSAQTLEGDQLYQVVTVRAAPGEYRALIDNWQDRIDDWGGSPESKPMWMRHTQGDHWDLMFLFPLNVDEGSPEVLFDPDRDANGFAGDDRVAFAEDLFVWGPPLQVVRKSMAEGSFYHVEMFVALPGRQAELLAQRRMENSYLAALNRPQNLIFRRAGGAAIDAFTLGSYSDIKHFAASADISMEDEERAARGAGFDGVMAISPYLRSLITRHHDTLAVAIN